MIEDKLYMLDYGCDMYGTCGDPGASGAGGNVIIQNDNTGGSGSGDPGSSDPGVSDPNKTPASTDPQTLGDLLKLVNSTDYKEGDGTLSVSGVGAAKSNTGGVMVILVLLAIGGFLAYKHFKK